VDDWLVDVCYSATQKCLSCPPGLAPVTFGDRALTRLRNRKRKPISWYLDLSMIEATGPRGSARTTTRRPSP